MQRIDYALWTNALFIAPLFYALYWGLGAYGFLVGVTLIASTFYHRAGMKQYAVFDFSAAIALSMWNLFAMHQAGYPSPLFEIALGALIVALLFYNRQHYQYTDTDHALWHVFAVIATLACIAAYATI